MTIALTAAETMDTVDYAHLRFIMVEQQIRPWDVLDQRVLEVVGRLPREEFVGESYCGLAYADVGVPLGHGEFMLEPKIVARALQALAPRGNEVALEIGTGSGYLTACLASLATQVDSVDIEADFKRAAQARLKAIGINNATLRVADAAHGWGLRERYDVIAVTASLPEAAQLAPFEQRLSVGGRLFVVVGTAPVMHAMLITRVDEASYTRVKLFETCIKPLRGLHKTQIFSL
ncbi:protein-L-isoaspartate O-methyltransferase family protein [Acidihalobacter aeolianus]|uniref:protein-L-isoaspartate O-methyltransferase family protein n=1 Tax=Acidihalobacter aeolianus TaxID=2792603 RepID=UPI000B198464|nr:protein-L-isoaspartate O-methyltransferase [Acidihalobacter aeolianus]